MKPETMAEVAIAAAFIIGVLGLILIGVGAMSDPIPWSDECMCWPRP
jgi:hypothetical protein